MSKHTPGPWTAEFHGSVWHIEEGGGVQLSCVYVWTEDDGEKEAAANARLMAAAPELLAALKRTLSNAIGHACDARGDDCNFEDWPWVQQAREAINNATKEEA